MNRKKIERIERAMSEIQNALSNIKQILSSENTEVDDNESYNKGLEDAWELAQKLWLPESSGGLHHTKVERIYEDNMYDIPQHFTVQEALAKLEAYEKEQEIKVGDVVSCTETKGTAVVAKKPTDNEIYILWNDGSTGRHNIEDFKKTGKHIDISSILEQIKE